MQDGKDLDTADQDAVVDDERESAELAAPHLFVCLCVGLGRSGYRSQKLVDDLDKLVSEAGALPLVPIARFE